MHRATVAPNRRRAPKARHSTCALNQSLRRTWIDRQGAGIAAMRRALKLDETVCIVLWVCLVSSAGKYDAAQDAAAQHCAAREPDYSACVRPRCSASVTNLRKSMLGTVSTAEGATAQLTRQVSAMPV